MRLFLLLKIWKNLKNRKYTEEVHLLFWICSGNVHFLSV